MAYVKIVADFVKFRNIDELVVFDFFDIVQGTWKSLNLHETLLLMSNFRMSSCKCFVP